MSHKLVSLYIGEGEYYTRTDADNVIAEKDEEIQKWKAARVECERQFQAQVEETGKYLSQVLELKNDIADLRNDRKLTDVILDERNAEIAELKAKADKLHSCLKCLVMRDLIKDCQEKKSAIKIVKEYK